MNHSLGDISYWGSTTQEGRGVEAVMMTFLVILLIILLLNLLVAVMSEAYEDIKMEASNRWCYTQFKMIYAHKTEKLRKKKEKERKIEKIAKKKTEIEERKEALNEMNEVGLDNQIM